MKKGEWKLVNLYPGAHIRCKIGNFYHHGIYIGSDEVVQFGLPFDMLVDAKDIKVIKSPISDFCGANDFIEVYCYSKKELKQKFSDDVIIANALSHLGEGGYSIIKNNCEHFANLCIFGKKSSDQIDNVYKDVEGLLKKEK